MKKKVIVICYILFICLIVFVQTSDAGDRYIKLACDYNCEIDEIDWRNLPTRYERGTDYYIIDKFEERLLDINGEPFAEFAPGKVGVVRDFNKEKNYILFSFDGDVNNKPTHLRVYINGNNMKYEASARIASYGILRKETFPSQNVTKHGSCRVMQTQQIKL